MADKVFVPAVGKSMSREHRLMIALNWGNEINRERVTDDHVDADHRMTESQALAVLKTLDKADWDFVQGVWDQNDAYWPQIKAKERRLTGLTPQKVEAAPVFTKFGVYRGGYFPIAYDPALSSMSAAMKERTDAKLEQLGRVTQATTRRHHLKARQEGLGAPLLLSLDVVACHLDDVIHDLTHHEAILNANRILDDEAGRGDPRPHGAGGAQGDAGADQEPGCR